MHTTHAPTSIRPGSYDVDPERTTIRFRTRHMFGLGPVHGTFALRSGAITVTEPVDGSAVYAEIDAASFRTGNPQRDQTILQRRYLDASRYPVITFASHGIQRHDTGQAAGAIGGTLTVRGVERPVTLVVTAAEQAGADVAVSATLHIDRFDFGMTAMRGVAGRYLDLELAAICVPRTSARSRGGQHRG